MTTWPTNDLETIGNAEELSIRSRRFDGTLRQPVIVWVVRVDNGLYVRAVGGRNSPWFRGTQNLLNGRISTGRIERDVRFAEVDCSLHPAIDAQYRSKYADQPIEYVDPCVTRQAQAATLALIPTAS